MVPLKVLCLEKQEHQLKDPQVLEDRGLAADRLNQSNKYTLLCLKINLRLCFFNKKEQNNLVEFLLGWKLFTFIPLFLST